MRRREWKTLTDCFWSSVFFMMLMALVSSPAFAGSQILKIDPDERWWAGVISHSHLMPLYDKPYSFDSYGDTAGNQVQPLLISNQGRYIWSEDPFRFEFRDGAIHLSSRFGPV